MLSSYFKRYIDKRNGQEAKVRTGYGTIDWFRIGNQYIQEYIQAVYHHVTYLTYIQGESENHSVVSRSLQPHGLYSAWKSPG